MKLALSEELFLLPSGSCLPTSRVKVIHRRMHPKSGSVLVTTTDNASYVLKWLFPRVDSTPVKEVVGSELGRQLQLPMASWAALTLDRQTLDACAHITTESGAVASEPGLYFGSRMPTEGGSFFEYLPTPMLHASPQARVDAALIQIFDLWVGQPGRRQYLARVGSDGIVSLKFIRNSATLSDSSFTMFQTEDALCMYSRVCHLAGSRRPVQTFIERILHWSSLSLAETLGNLPSTWTMESQVKDILTTLTHRQNRLEKLWRGWERLDTQEKQHGNANFMGHSCKVGSSKDGPLLF